MMTPPPSCPQVVIGFFGDNDMDEDEYVDFMEAAKQLQPRADIFFAEVLMRKEYIRCAKI
jgi:hypothetical protein